MLVQTWVQCQVQRAVGVVHMPRGHRLVPVVVPPQLPAELVQPSVDGDGVLREAGRPRPAGTELQADQLTGAGSACAAAPVPVDRVRPAASPDVEHAPRGLLRTELVQPVASTEGAVRRSCLVLGRELEPALAPRDHHAQGLVPRRHRDEHVELPVRSVGLAPAHRQVRAARVVGEPHGEVPVVHTQGSARRHVRQRDAPGEGAGQVATTGLTGAQVPPPHRGEPDASACVTSPSPPGPAADRRAGTGRPRR